MSRPVRHIIITLSLALISVSSMAQLSLSEMLRYGDMAYDQKKYASAIHFYMMIVNEDTKVDRISSYPYRLANYTGEIKEKEDKGEVVSDSAMVDSLGNPIDSLAVEEPEPEIQPEAGDEGSEVDPNELYATHRIAECARLMNDYETAKYWYVLSMQMAWATEENEYPLDRYWYGTILMNLGEYKDAQKEFSEFMLEAEDIDDSEVKYYRSRTPQMIRSCYYGQSPASASEDFNVTRGDSLMNNGSASFAATYFDHDEILISSARFTSTADDDNDIPSNFLSDIFIMRRSNGRWQGAQNVAGDLSSRHHESAASVGEDKEIMYFTRSWFKNEQKPKIYSSRYFVNKWMPPRELGEAVNVKGYTSQHPYVTKDNKMLFFASDRPGGQGGMDIWYCKIDRKGRTSDPINLGPQINSPEDEITPFYHEPTGILYFSSKAYDNLGGFDVFKAVFSPYEGITGKPQNMKSPVNSSKNDKYFVLSDLQTEGFFTSNREQCEGCEGSSYCNQIYTFTKAENQFLLSGLVFDAETFEPIPNAMITVKDVKYEFDPFFITTDSAGYYEMEIEPEMHIFLKAQKVEYFADANVLSTIGVAESQDYQIDFFLSKIPYEEIVIPGIYYDYDKATLRPRSLTVLDSLVEFLKINDNLIIEISSHTDDRGSHDYNDDLSQRRAQSVVDYLIEHEIPESRLVAKGYGKRKLLIEDAETEEEHQKNRRTSFRILSEDFEEINKIRPKKPR